MKNFLVILTLLILSVTSCRRPTAHRSPEHATVTIVVPAAAAPRVSFGTERLRESLESAGYTVQSLTQDQLPGQGPLIVVGELQRPLVREALAAAGIVPGTTPGKEGFSVTSGQNITVVGGADASGVLYGCLELAEQVRQQGQLPPALSLTDQPEMVLRGACIGLQKTEYLPGRTVYEYPYTPENFPWFYDKELWIRYLDMLAENRMNSLYLWNGHPFAPLVKLQEYPYAVEVEEETFRKNEEMFRFLTEEADKRGIWVIQMFYNILVSKPFAEKHGIKTQDRKQAITPLLGDYTRKSISAFVQKYPNVGLLITLGEAMEGDENDVRWFTETIIPGVQDGLKALGTATQPPIVLRGHDTNPQLVMQQALPLYQHLYTMNKYNGEALTTYEPRGPWAEMHQDLGRLGSTHIDNVHILANLEPFRYGSADFIQKSVRAMHEVHGANGLHLYPESSYWDWPYTADKAAPRLLQLDRDRVWYKAWARYAWNASRDRQEEIKYWTRQLGDDFGCGEHGRDILEAYEEAGEISPKLLRIFGITYGNRQTLTLGMFMSQLVNPHKWRVWPHLYDSDGPEGEMLIEYAEKEWKGLPHVGETPPQVIEEVVRHGQLAVEAIDRAAPHIRQNQAEFARMQNDMYCQQALANFYAEKALAALAVLRYSYSDEVADLERALPHLEKSVEHFQALTDLTKDRYLYANSMQTGQRRIPIGGNDGKNKTWVELLPYYQEELQAFKTNLAFLQSSQPATVARGGTAPYKPAPVIILAPNARFYPLSQGQNIYADHQQYQIQEVAEELKALQGLRLSLARQQAEGTIIRFRNTLPVKVLVGYFRTNEKGYLAPPNLETDASANDQGQAEVRIANAIDLPELPPVNIHTYSFAAGDNRLKLGKGACLVLGFVDGPQKISTRDAGFTGIGSKKDIEWLFEKSIK